MARGYISPTIRNPGGSNDADFIIYGYVPSLVLAIIGIVTFVLCTCAHIGQVARYRTWYFTLLVVGSAMEIVGYVFRSLSSKVDPYFVPYFVVQYFFIVVAPVFFSAGKHARQAESSKAIIVHLCFCLVPTIFERIPCCLQVYT